MSFELGSYIMRETLKVIILIVLAVLVVVTFTTLIILKRKVKKETIEYKKREAERMKALEEIEREAEKNTDTEN